VLCKGKLQAVPGNYVEAHLEGEKELALVNEVAWENTPKCLALTSHFKFDFGFTLQLRHHTRSRAHNLNHELTDDQYRTD
jgi:hypothetical protein